MRLRRSGLQYCRIVSRTALTGGRLMGWCVYFHDRCCTWGVGSSTLHLILPARVMHSQNRRLIFDPQNHKMLIEKRRPKLVNHQIVQIYNIIIQFLGPSSSQFLHRVNNALFLELVETGEVEYFAVVRYVRHSTAQTYTTQRFPCSRHSGSVLWII